MIKYNNNTIYDWNFDTSNIIKVYRNNAIVFYKVSGESPTPEYKVCFAVVDDITQYQETEFDDVFDNATEKWYKLNNLNQYEEYGVYGSGRTTCEGSTSRLPQGYTEVEYIRNSNYNAYINTGVIPYDNTSNRFTVTARVSSEYHSNLACATIIDCEEVNSPYYGFGYRYKCSAQQDVLEFFGADGTVSKTSASTSGDTVTLTFDKTANSTKTMNVPLYIFGACENSSYTSATRYSDSALYSMTVVKNNETVRDFVPAKRDSDDKYGLYDLITDTFYTSPNGNNFIGGEPVTPTNCVTTYNGKLTIDDGYEYEWNGSSWVNLGEVSGSTRLPQGYTEVEYVENTSTAYINTEVLLYDSTTNSYEIETKMSSTWGGGEFEYLLATEGTSAPYNGLELRWNTHYQSGGELQCESVPKNVTYSNINNGDGTSAITISCTSTNATNNVPLSLFCGIWSSGPWRNGKGKIYDLKITKNDVLVRDLVPCKRDSDDKYGMYDIVNDVFYISPNNVNLTGGDPITPTDCVTTYKGKLTIDDGYEYEWNGSSWVNVGEVSHTVYPKYYTEKSDPLDDLTFNTLAEAKTYAYNNCVYDGMKATIDGDRYYFDSEDENGWVKILEYYKVEDVTSGGASGWTISRSSTYNPDLSYYDDFDLETNSTSDVTKIAKVTIYGYDHFTYYLRTSGYSTYCYAVATNVDEVSTPPSTMSYNSSSAITNTYNWNQTPKSAVNLSKYRRITYNNLDKTVEHTFYVYFYGRAYSSYVGNATILIPKEQTNENWEQVTFSASSNVASAQKYLYIDNNYSTSGGTQYWFYRWIIGLPSGSHSSNTNYSNYGYCPNATSSTFTSVAGEQRQVNFTYDGTTNKTLSFRLTDGSNVLTPSDTVYYNMTLYNSCNVSSTGSNWTFPRSLSVKVGGRFYFQNSSNRHYIYGYTAPTTGTTYYVDNYQSTFDIVYTKLSDEAVTITYTTFDPNDVETPAFNTDITYPYNGGTTSSTTLTSFDVPYTYPYEVSQTSDMFSADSQSFTAGQAARTINFVLYPNNREFASVADMEAYAYAWEGMNANVGDTKYKYENGEWVENKHSLPDVPFVLNYNAKQYNASTHTIPYTEGALNAINAVITGTTANIIDHSSDGYIELTGYTTTAIRALVGTTNFSRSNSNPNITIICKAYTPGYSTEGNILSNRNQSYNWMYRHKSTQLRFHGTSEQGSIAVSNTEPNTCSVRIDSSRLLKYNNWTQNTTSTVSNFSYGSDSNGGALFAGYYSNSGEFWKGVFYWIYMSLNTLTDEQVQQVIDYNENL